MAERRRVLNTGSPSEQARKRFALSFSLFVRTRLVVNEDVERVLFRGTANSRTHRRVPGPESSLSILPIPVANPVGTATVILVALLQYHDKTTRTVIGRGSVGTVSWKDNVSTRKPKHENDYNSRCYKVIPVLL